MKHIDKDHPNFKYDRAVVPELEDLDKFFLEDSQKGDIMIANDFQVKTEVQREELISKLTKTYTDDTLDEPINGANVLFEEIRPSMWLKPLGDGYYLQPRFFSILSKVLTKHRVNVLQYAMDPTYKPPTHTPQGPLKQFIDAGFPRGMKAFHDNFDAIMDVLLISQYQKRMQRKNNLAQGKRFRYNVNDYVVMMIEKYRHLLFCKHLPIPSPHTFVMEQRGKNKSSEISLMQHAFDAVMTVTSVGMQISSLTPNKADRLDYKVNSSLATFYEVYGKDYLKAKVGIFRQNSYGTTTSFNARAVIVSKQGVHNHESLTIPYSLAFKIFELHLAKIYIDEKGYSPIDIFEARAEFARQYNEEIHQTLTRLIMDFWGGRGWLAPFLRHPFLFKLSAQLFNIDEIGKDPMDNTIEMSPMTLAATNADFNTTIEAFYSNVDRTTSLIAGTHPKAA